MEEEDIFHSPQTVSEERDEKAAAAAADEDENRKLCLMRATIETKDPSCKEIDDLTLRRFLRARDLDVEKASAMFLKYSEWRRTFVPKGYMSESEIRDEIAQKKMFMQGRDKQGRPIAVVFASRHFAAKGGVDEFRHFQGSWCSRSIDYVPEFLMDKRSSQLLEMLKDLATATAMFVGSCSYQHFTGILPRKTRKSVHHSRTIYIYDVVEDRRTVHRQKYQEEGKSSFFAFSSLLHNGGGLICVSSVQDRVCREQETACYSAGGHRRKPASRGVWRETGANSHSKRLGGYASEPGKLYDVYICSK
ncbi:UNVERIFIED_CONTAM: hypothetical protein Sradi_0113300 [Sesamum radiatum]|uniref:CRAL/TRIO N-terminal domain-containing protein n=1 Tax=Sesamum radiatum TaxID=300843 RepID=A0AAW2WIR7_SESRA